MSSKVSRFLYKIYSGYDGFTPKRIPERMLASRVLQLGWQRYLDSVDEGDEVWIYFHGPHRFEPGVYAKGFVREIDATRKQVLLRVREYDQHQPLIDPELSRRIASVVAARGLQVFLFPEEWATTTICDVYTSARSCGQRLCGDCPTWRSLPRIEPRALGVPKRLPPDLNFAPAYWVIPSRCYLYSENGRLSNEIERTSAMFMRFKTGEHLLAYPLALSMYESLRARNLYDFDCIVAIPLSPDKGESGEIHRTRLLGKELAKLLGTRLVEALSLRRPISKRQLRVREGLTAHQFESRYLQALEIDERISQCENILLLDDVCTEGSTLRCAAQLIRRKNTACKITLVTAGQMIVKAAVADQSGLLQ